MTKLVCTCPSGDGSLRWPCPTHTSNSPSYMVLVSRKDAEAVARFAFNNAGKGLRAPVAEAGERILGALHKEKQCG